MNVKLSMCEFVYGRCELAKESGKFVSVWLKTNRNPCSKCGADKSMCSFYKELVDMEAISEEENSP
jgi:hypothetical protein